MEQSSGLRYGPRLVISNFSFSVGDRERLREAVGADSLLLVDGAEALREALAAHPETDVLCTFRPPTETLQLAPHLHWLALPSAGAEHVLRSGLVRPISEGGPVVTTANGVHSVPISEFVLSMLLLWARRWPTLIALQHATTWPDHTRWEQLSGRELHSATLGVVGLGAIGRAVAHLGRSFGMHVIGTRRSASPGASDPDVDELLPQSELKTLLARADFVVIAVPNTPETHHLIGMEQLRTMKSTAFLVNIARGSIIDEVALVEALRMGTISGAGLDVFEEEPLPATSPLWAMPNVIIAPHISGATDQYSRRFTDLFLENLARYRAGQPLRNVVDPVRGY